MSRNERYTPKNDLAAQQALRDEANKPEPLYNKTDRNFQTANQQGTHDPQKVSSEHTGSNSSGEEKDII